MNKKVMIASPISYKMINGEPFFTGVGWLHSVLAQDYNPLSVYAMTNDLGEGMLHKMVSIQDDRLFIDNKDFGNKTDDRKARKLVHKQYEQFAQVRNEVLDFVLATEADYYVSIDSDIIVHPDCVSRLVHQIETHEGYAMIAAAVNNECQTKNNKKYPRAAYNFGSVMHRPPKYPKGSKRPIEKYTYNRPRFKEGAFVDADYTGACMIMDVGILRDNPELRWGAHRSGEDIYMCERIREAGYKIGVDTSIVTLHLMDDIGWREHLKAFKNNRLA